jgi:hypothetical protein
MPGIVVTVTSGTRSSDGRVVVAETAVLLASWGYRVLCIDTRPPAELPNSVELPWVDGRRLASGFGRIALEMIGDGASASEDERDAWLASYDVVLVAAPPYHLDRNSEWCYRMADFVVALYENVALAADEFRLVTRRWADARDLLPLDRAQLIVIPVPIADRLSPLAYMRDTMDELCRNWLHRRVDIMTLLGRLTRRPDRGQSVGLPTLLRSKGVTGRNESRTLAALIAHRCARTDMLVDSPTRYVATARWQDTAAFEYDVVLVSARGDRRSAQQLATVLEGQRLRVLSVGADQSEVADGRLARAVCALVGAGHEELFPSVRQLARWDADEGPLPLVVAAFLPEGRPSDVGEPLASGEWIRLERGSRRLGEAAARIAELIRD